MFNYAQKTPLIVYDTSSVKILKIYRIYNYIVFLCVDYRSNCVNKSKFSKLYFKTLFPFLRKKLYALVWIPLETQTNFNKAKIFSKYFALSTWTVADSPRFILDFES